MEWKGEGGVVALVQRMSGRSEGGSEGLKLTESATLLRLVGVTKFKTFVPITFTREITRD
jgi:hypothetical protein